MAKRPPIPDPYETADTAAELHELEHEPPELVTSTGRYPAIVIKPETRSRAALGMLLDVVALICITVLIGLDKLSPTEGLPWVALLLGLKARSAANGKRTTSQGGGAILSMFGMLR